MSEKATSDASKSESEYWVHISNRKTSLFAQLKRTKEETKTWPKSKKVAISNYHRTQK